MRSMTDSTCRLTLKQGMITAMLLSLYAMAGKYNRLWEARIPWPAWTLAREADTF
ncbi:MAG: hypothetical protein RLZZ385_684 [Pseudomonadota bacterium]|jgi:hypothetical protein